jgi:hypothetical protein
MLTQVSQQPGVTAVDNPYTATGSEHINPSVNTAYATVTLAARAPTATRLCRQPGQRAATPWRSRWVAQLSPNNPRRPTAPRASP